MTKRIYRQFSPEFKREAVRLAEHTFATDSALLGRCYQRPVFAIRCKYTMEAGQIDSGFGYQGDQPGDGRSSASCARSMP